MNRFVCYFYFVGWWSISLGVSLDLITPNLEIHVPFGFFRIGLSSWIRYGVPAEIKWQLGRTVGLGEVES